MLLRFQLHHENGSNEQPTQASCGCSKAFVVKTEFTQPLD